MSGRNEELYNKYKNVLKGAVEGAVVTRFPPEPSGYLHIGHVKAAMLNYHYSKIYKGKMILRFDDTNPLKENQNFVDNIIQDLQNLEIYPDTVSYTSDWFGKTTELMEELIRRGLAYLDNTIQEEMQKERFDGIESKCRSQTVEENLALWSEFLKGSKPDYCVRGKINMQDKNKCMRDPVFYRLCEVPHHRTGTQYKVYPTYDFACPIVDSLEGVTHCLRTSEYNDRNPMYHWVIRSLDLRKVEIRDFSRLNLVNTLLSKRSLQKLVDTGIVEGWFDPRFPTVQGILRRGLLVQTLKEFMLEQGPTKNTVLMDWTTLWATNKKILDPISPRYTAISSEDVCILHLSNGPAEPRQELHPLHPKLTDLGTCPITYFNKILLEHDDAKTLEVNEKVTLMKWGNVKILEILPGGNEEFLGHPVKIKLVGEYLPDDKDFKSTKKFTWLSAVPELYPLDLVEYDVLITKPKVEENDDVMSLINENSKFVTKAFGMEALRGVSEGIVQLERRGFYKIDKVREGTSELIYVPDGRSKGMSTISSKVDHERTSKGSEQTKQSKKLQDRAEKKKKIKEAEGKEKETKEKVESEAKVEEEKKQESS